MADSGWPKDKPFPQVPAVRTSAYFSPENLPENPIAPLPNLTPEQLAALAQRAKAAMVPTVRPPAPVPRFAPPQTQFTPARPSIPDGLPAQPATRLGGGWAAPATRFSSADPRDLPPAFVPPAATNPALVRELETLLGQAGPATAESSADKPIPKGFVAATPATPGAAADAQGAGSGRTGGSVRVKGAFGAVPGGGGEGGPVDLDAGVADQLKAIESAKLLQLEAGQRQAVAEAQYAKERADLEARYAAEEEQRRQERAEWEARRPYLAGGLSATEVAELKKKTGALSAYQGQREKLLAMQNGDARAQRAARMKQIADLNARIQTEGPLAPQLVRGLVAERDRLIAADTQQQREVEKLAAEVAGQDPRQLQAEAAKAQRELDAASKVDPGRLMKGWRGVLATLGAAMGAFGAAFTKGPNFALEFINKAIDDDIAQQEGAVAEGERKSAEMSEYDKEMRRVFREDVERLGHKKADIMESIGNWLKTNSAAPEAQRMSGLILQQAAQVRHKAGLDAADVRTRRMNAETARAQVEMAVSGSGLSRDAEKRNESAAALTRQMRLLREEFDRAGGGPSFMNWLRDIAPSRLQNMLGTKNMTFETLRNSLVPGYMKELMSKGSDLDLKFINEAIPTFVTDPTSFGERTDALIKFAESRMSTIEAERAAAAAEGLDEAATQERLRASARDAWGKFNSQWD